MVILRLLSLNKMYRRKSISFIKANKKKFLAISLISIILFQVPIVNITNVISEEITKPENIRSSIPVEDEVDQFSNSTEEKSNIESIVPPAPPEDIVIQFSNSPDVVFDINYYFAQEKVQINIRLRNNLTNPISLLNLWIQVNKSDPDERILLSATFISEESEKLSLSTFDTSESMIFHIKLYEGEIIEVNEEFDEVFLTWVDPDGIFAQYNPNLLYNDIADDIEAYFEYSIDTEEPQLFPLIERQFYQFRTLMFCVDFRITNLMSTDLDVFNFTYVKIKDFTSEQYLDLSIQSPFLSSSEISNIELSYSVFNDRIEYYISFSQNVILSPNEWFKILTKWAGVPGESTIGRDLIIWNTGDDDPFNFGYPFYDIGDPFYPVLSPAEPIVDIDYDGDGLRNNVEISNGLNPYVQEPWLTWETLRSNHYVAAQYSSGLELGGKIGIVIPSDFSNNELIMDVQSLGVQDTLKNITVNNELIYNDITSIGRFSLANPANDYVYKIKLRVSHDVYGNMVASTFSIKFLIGNTEIIDMSSFFQLDSDGDGLIDDLEESAYVEVPDVDNDGLIDGSDVMPFTKIECAPNEIYKLNFPIYDTNSEIGVNIQIKPTIDDYTETFDYRGNELYILPGLRIYSLNVGGDYLPDNCFSIDDGLTGLIRLVPLNSFGNEKPYTWSKTLIYESANLAKNDNQITLRFQLSWLIFEHDPIKMESKLLHIYDNTNQYTIQGISITENHPTNIVLGLVDDGSDYRNTGKNALLATYDQVSNIAYDPNNYPSMELFPASCNDLSDVNNTRDELRNYILEQKNLDIATTNFIYLTYGYTMTYNFKLLIDEFGNIQEKYYTPTEINNFYSLPETSFFGIITTQLIRDDYIEFVKQFTYAYKNKTVESLLFNIQFSKCKYVASGSDEIYCFEGIKEESNVWIFWFDFKEKENLIKIRNAESFQFTWNLPIFSLSLSGPTNETLIEFTGLYDDIPILGDMFNTYLKKYEGDKAIGQIPVKLAEIGVFIGAILEAMGKFVDWGGRVGLLSKGMGVFSLIVGGLRLGYGIDLINQGAYKTGMAEVNRAVMSIYSGILAFCPANPVTLVLTAIVLVVTLVDWICSLFGYDMWGELLEWCGLEDANPAYEITDYYLSYDTALLKHQGSFRVGDQVSFHLAYKNTGNTKMWLRVKIGAGYLGEWGEETEMYTRGGKYFKNEDQTTVTDTFEVAYPMTVIKIYTSLNWYYDESGAVIVVAYPPFIIYYDPDPVWGGPYSNVEEVTFDMPVMPQNINEFIYLLRSGLWFPDWIASPPETSVTPIKDEIIPIFSEDLAYWIRITNRLSSEQTFDLIGSNEEMWDYTFYKRNFLGYYTIPTTEITLDPWEQKKIKVWITPTSINPLRPGNHTSIVRVQSQEASFIRSNVNLDYEIIPLIGFKVDFDPILIEGLDLGGDDYLAYFINVTNTGNLHDNYTVEILNLDIDLYDLYKSALSAYPLRMDSSLIVFYIPWGKIVFPGEIYFNIKVSSHADPNLIKMFNCILDIQEYHRMSFFVEEANLTLTDSDIFDYNLHLTNLGNVEVPFNISYTNVSFANTFIPQSSYIMIPGQYENFNLTMIPFELGTDSFTITATTPYISKTIEAYITVLDDDILPPWFEAVIIKDNCFFLNISFLAFDEVEWHSDDIGIANISIYVDDVLIHNYLPTPSETEFNFTFTNDWIMEYGNHTIRIEITDADNDRPNDALTTILEATFEVTPDEMMEYILWELSELEDYIEDVLPFCFNRPLINHLHRAQCKVWWALYFYNFGYDSKAVLLDMLAKASLEFYDMFIYVVLKHHRISEEVGDYILAQVHKIRDHLSLTMGAIVGTETALEIANIIVEISQFVDNFSIYHNFCLYMAIQHYIRCAIGELEFVLYLMSKGYLPECFILEHISHAIFKLELTQKKIECLVKCGKISEECGLLLIEKIEYFISKISNLENFL